MASNYSHFAGKPSLQNNAAFEMKKPSIIWRTANRLLSSFGCELRPLKPEGPQFAMDAVLARAAARGVKIGTVVDLGAAAGRWTRRALRHFPEARFLMVDPLEERRAPLEQMKAANPNADYILAAAGAARGEARFTVGADLDGSGIYDGPGSRAVPVIALDGELATRQMPAPFLLKFDTHGFELPILAGAKDTLSKTAAILMECYNFQLTQGCLRFHEMCAHLDALGFRPADIAEPMLRPGDGVLWQLIFFFSRRIRLASRTRRTSVRHEVFHRHTFV